MTLDAEAFTVVAYGLLALVTILYFVLLRAFLTRDDEEPEEAEE